MENTDGNNTGIGFEPGNGTGAECADGSRNAGTLYVVSTPIGNLGDLSPRALETLKNADLIAAEDTRTTAGLLEKCGLTGEKPKMLPSHKFNEGSASARIVGELLSGKDVALVTDAGTPCVSDPGFPVVRDAAAAGVAVTAVPGCCAAVAALSVSGFSALSFSFYGFLPRTAGEIRRVFARVSREYPATVVFYESPNRIGKTVSLLAECLPDSSVCLCNDLTKKFERVYRGSPSEVSAELESNPNAGKGEYVLVLSLPGKREGAEEQAGRGSISPEAALIDRMAKEGVSLRDAVRSLASEGNAPKSVWYDASLRLKKLLGNDEKI